jgi:hypothetical protein
MNGRRSAEKIRDLSLETVSQLSRILNASRPHCSAAEFERMKKGVGSTIAPIQTEMPDPIYACYPVLDDLCVWLRGEDLNL